MVNNIKISSAIYIGIGIIVIFAGGLYASPFNEFIFTAVTLGLFFLFGRLMHSQESRAKTILSLAVPSAIGFMLSIAACLVYQHFVVDLYHYTKVPFVYKAVWGFAYYLNAPILPVSELLGNLSRPFLMPYGLAYTFFAPIVMMWLGLERKDRKKGKNKEAAADVQP